MGHPGFRAENRILVCGYLSAIGRPMGYPGLRATHHSLVIVLESR